MEPVSGDVSIASLSFSACGPGNRPETQSDSELEAFPELQSSRLKGEPPGHPPTIHGAALPIVRGSLGPGP